MNEIVYETPSEETQQALAELELLFSGLDKNKTTRILSKPWLVNHEIEFTLDGEINVYLDAGC